MACNKIQIFSFIQILSPKKYIFEFFEPNFFCVYQSYLSEINNFEWIMPYFQGGLQKFVCIGNATFSVTVTQPLIHFQLTFSIFGNFDWILPANTRIPLEIAPGIGIWRRFAVSRPFNARSQLHQGSWPDEMKRG